MQKVNVEFQDNEFVKSTQSQYSWNKCVMIARKDGFVGVRDSKDSEKNTLIFTNDEWEAFLDGAKKGEFEV